MKLPVQIGVGLLVFIMFMKSLMIPFVYIDFKLNQDYIAKVLCINRDKPELHCNGRCILMQKMKKAQDTEQSQENQTNKKQTFETFCESLFDFNALKFLAEKEEFIAYQMLFLSHYLSDIFHPPKLRG